MIYKKYVDPIAGVESDVPPETKKSSMLSMPMAINYRDDKTPYAAMEVVPDQDIKSVTMHVVIDWLEAQLGGPLYKKILKNLYVCVQGFLNAKLPASLDWSLESTESGSLFIEIPDYSSCSAFNFEMLAEILLKEIVRVLIKCRKCGFIVDGSSGICPECGEELAGID